MKKTVIVNIYNFIRKSHEEPSRFIQDDFDTIQKQMQVVRQYGLPATYALKYDALTDERYQKLLRENTDPQDEISAWWEITRELCEKAGVRFRGKVTEEFDERVNSAYSIGYEPEERKRLVDAYMDTFHEVFGKYPQSIGSWVLDTVTLEYAARKYGITAGATCRDQIGTDGFTLWGGYPNGVYYPSRLNENLPAQAVENQLSVPVFRLLGPDPIYNFEQNLRPDLYGMVFTLEPAWLTGRDEKWISWMFDNLTREDALGIGYAQVGQENNFLWENIGPGYMPQLAYLAQLAREGHIRVETMGASGAWFRKKYRLTPPMTWQASRDWDAAHNLCAQWYASCCYRIGFLGEAGHLRVRDFFLYRDEYPSRYREHAMTNAKSTFDALPVLYPQLWTQAGQPRPFIRLLDGTGREPEGTIRFYAENETRARAELTDPVSGNLLAGFRMSPDCLVLEGGYTLVFDRLPVFRRADGPRLEMEHEGFVYHLTVETGTMIKAGAEGVCIAPADGKICLRLADVPLAEPLYTPQYLQDPTPLDRVGTVWKPTDRIPPFPPEMCPAACIFPSGAQAQITLHTRQEGIVRYTTDGSLPDEHAPVYTGSITLREDTVLSARLFLPDGRSSEVTRACYRFVLMEMELQSPTCFDPRAVFSRGGIRGLLAPQRGSCDYLCGEWLGTLQDLDVTAVLPQPREIESIGLGFLSHHRSGIVFPEYIELFTGPDAAHLTLKDTLRLPCTPCEREIVKQDFVFPVGERVGSFRVVAHRYAKMPAWCAYKGVPDVFTMADTLLVKPKEP